MSSKSMRVYASGTTPETAIRELCIALGLGEPEAFEPEPARASDEWFYRFTAGGVSMKAAGDHVPGGVTLTWWK